MNFYLVEQNKLIETPTKDGIKDVPRWVTVARFNNINEAYAFRSTLKYSRLVHVKQITVRSILPH